MLPQLDLTHYLSQIFWLIVCLTVLIVAMRKVFIPRMNGIIRKREKAIASGSEKLEELERVRNELSKTIRTQIEGKAREYAIERSKENYKYNAVLTANLIKLKVEHNQMVKRLKDQYKAQLETITTDEVRSADALVDQALDRLTATEHHK